MSADRFACVFVRTDVPSCRSRVELSLPFEITWRLASAAGYAKLVLDPLYERHVQEQPDIVMRFRVDRSFLDWCAENVDDGFGVPG